MKNILVMIITVTIGIIFAGSLLAPVIGDVTATEKTFTNDGMFYVEMDPEDEYTVEYSKTDNPEVLVINGEALSLSFTTEYTVFAIDNAILRLSGASSTLQYKGDGSYIVGIDSIDLTISNGSVTGTYTNTTYTTPTSWPTTTYTKAYVASPDTNDLIMTKYSVPVKVNGDSDIFAFGQTLMDGTLRLVKIEGNIDDGVEVSVLDTTSGEPIEGATVSDLSINYTSVNGYLDLYELTSITFVVTLSNDVATDVSYSAYIVPASVTAELSQHLDDSEITLMQVMPLILIACLLLGAVGFIVYRGRD